MTIVILALGTAFIMGMAISPFVLWCMMYSKSHRCKVCIPINNKEKKIYFLITFILCTICTIAVANTLSIYPFTTRVFKIITLVIYVCTAVGSFVEYFFLSKAYLTENGIMEVYTLYPRDSAKYTIEKIEKKTFVNLHIKNNTSDPYYRIKKVDEAIPLLDELYGASDGTSAPAQKRKSYLHRFFLASIVTGLLLMGILSAWYAIKRPIVFVGDKIVRTDSEYALFNYGIFTVIRDCYEYFPEMEEKFDDMHEAVDYTNTLTSNDLEELKNMPNLKHLDIDENSITDLSEIGELILLEGLYLGGSDRFDKPKDFTHLKNLTNLKYFYGFGLDLNDLTVFENADGLLYFELSGADIQNGLDIVCSKDDLTVLSLSSCTSDDFSPIGNCKKLKRLGLSNTNVNDLSFLKYLTNVERLYIKGVHAEDYSALLEMPSLTYLSLYRGTIPEDILKKLEEKGVELSP